MAITFEQARQIADLHDTNERLLKFEKVVGAGHGCNLSICGKEGNTLAFLQLYPQTAARLVPMLKRLVHEELVKLGGIDE